MTVNNDERGLCRYYAQREASKVPHFILFYVLFNIERDDDV